MPERAHEIQKLNGQKVDLLLLLVGGNPLPNAVAGKLLLKGQTASRAAFICSSGFTGTEVVSDQLAEFLGLPKARYSKYRVEEWSPSSIQRKVEEALEGVRPGETVGLHYTGGTKAMSVHAYRAVERWAGVTRRVSYSYLDARHRKLVFDAAPNIPETEVWTDSMADQCTITLEELMRLHDWPFKTYKDGNVQKPKSSPIMPHAAAALAQTLSSAPLNEKKLTEWDVWLQHFRNQAKKAGKWVPLSELHTLQLNWPQNWPATDALQQTIEQRGNPTLCIGLAAPILRQFWPGDKRNTPAEHEFCEWINGKWLEHATLKALKDCETALNLHDIGQGVHAWVDRSFNVDMDLDVVAMRGYQMFAFSCGTAIGKQADAELKRKLFEADMRARQLGGDHACVALVCRSEQPKRLEREIRKTMDAGERIRVFGKEHLADLGAAFTDWISRV